ncbi:branched-chain amino acid transport system II carrier protein [Erysipelothrix aquatica]|uniref:branched-chain amino acid transport system II carrier protein n=1 Tax=Erysipelothrix aquatica TaxID=2683714 RepID=UPI0013570CEC|nr:branched-chain amino acid transport system II carrier protein [Erysipelothrix aquatica]
MKQTVLTRMKSRIVLASLLFGLFFGAGNLIFPVNIGQLSGSNIAQSSFGFILTAVGLASLGVIVCGRSKADSLEDMLQPYGRQYARMFTILLLLTIGPMFALPRTATVPYEVAIKALMPQANHQLGMLVYSFIFFGGALLIAIKPSKIEVWVAKIINPLFLIFLAVFFIMFMINPLGSASNTLPTGTYESSAFLTGFQMGYQTMDVLAALSFGFVIVQSTKENHPESQSSLVKDVVYASLISGGAMIFIYTMLLFIGSSSLNVLPVASNGGIALGQLFHYYFGRAGLIFFGITITFACITTAVGLITSCARYFSSIIPKVSYEFMAVVIGSAGFLVSNVGLEAIIQLSIPVLNFIYPLAIMHVIMGLVFAKLLDKKRVINVMLGIMIVVAIFETMMQLPFLANQELLRPLFTAYQTYVPLASIGLGWLNFMITGLCIGYWVQNISNRNTRPNIT